jgi:hypothetical protein
VPIPTYPWKNQVRGKYLSLSTDIETVVLFSKLDSKHTATKCKINMCHSIQLINVCHSEIKLHMPLDCEKQEGILSPQSGPAKSHL